MGPRWMSQMMVVHGLEQDWMQGENVFQQVYFNIALQMVTHFCFLTHTQKLLF